LRRDTFPQAPDRFSPAKYPRETSGTARKAPSPVNPDQDHRSRLAPSFPHPHPIRLRGPSMPARSLEPRVSAVSTNARPSSHPRSLNEYIVAIYQNQLKQEQIMSELSDQIAALGTNLNKAQNDIAKSISDLQAAVSAGNSTDVAAAVTALTAANAQLQGIDAAALAADPSPAPAPSAS
jgi:hypothetical protein